MAGQWYLTRNDERYGPYSWEELLLYARSGNIKSEDLVWNPITASWIRADQLPELTGEVAKHQAADPPIKAKKEKPPRKKTGLVIGSAVIILALAASLIFAYTNNLLPFFQMANSRSFPKRDVGEYHTKLPDPAFLIETEEWGELPANQIAILLAEGLGEERASQIADALGAEIVGYIELLNFYQLETAGRTVDDLHQALTAAESMPGVELAVPNQLVYSRITFEGTFCSPLSNPVYQGDNGRPYEMIGLQDAWDIIEASGVTLHPVRAGVIDRAIYSEALNQLSPELHVDVFAGSATGHGFELRPPDEGGMASPGQVKTIPLDRTRDLTNIPIHREGQSGPLELGGLGHGTAVAHVIAASHDRELAGVAANLRGNLELLVSVQGSGVTFIGSDDPENPAQWGTHSYGMLERMLEQVENGATVINLSWGPQRLSDHNKNMSDMVRKFLRIMHQEYPNVVFVAAAGNSGEGLNGNNDYWGKDLPNLITVGALNQNGGKAGPEDWRNPTRLRADYDAMMAHEAQFPAEMRKYPVDFTYEQYLETLRVGSNYATTGGEVTLSACGTDIPVGVMPDGKPITVNGTSFSAPQVAGAIALMQSINPDLSAVDIKRILTESASRQVEQNGVITYVPAELGAGVLRVDNAVLQVINEMREGAPLSREDLLVSRRIFLYAETVPLAERTPGQGKEWFIRAQVWSIQESNINLEIRTKGQGTVTGNPVQQLSGPDGGEVVWRVRAVDDHFEVKVYRSDTGECSFVLLSGVEITGRWAGYWKMTESDILKFTDEGRNPGLAKQGPLSTVVEGCEDAMIELLVELFKELLNKQVPMTLIFTATENETKYGGEITLDFSSVIPGTSQEVGPEMIPFEANFENGIISFYLEGDQGTMYFDGEMTQSDLLEGYFIYPSEDIMLMAGQWRVQKLED